MQAKDITTGRFVSAMVEAYVEQGYCSTKWVWKALGEDVPFKVVLAKMAKLEKQGVVEGCSCGCGSPMWLQDPDTEERFNSRMLSWDDTDRVMEIVARYA